MGKLTLDISMSLDGFIAGPNAGREHPLGEGGEQLHEWGIGLASWRERHGLEGGARNRSDEVIEEGLANTGATIMGRRMFSGGEGSWEDDPGRDGWWGDDPPFRMPVFILTQHAREPVAKQGGTTFTFVTRRHREPPSSRPAKRPVTRTSPLRAAPASSSSTCGPGCSTSCRSTSSPCSWAAASVSSTSSAASNLRWRAPG